MRISDGSADVCSSDLRLIDELVPSLAAVVDDVVVGGEDAVGGPVVAQELPDVFDGVKFGAFGRERDNGDVSGEIAVSGGVPSGLIHQTGRVSARRDGERYFSKVQGSGFGIAEGQHEQIRRA